MTKFGWLVVLGVLLVLGGIAAIIYFIPKTAPAPEPVEVGTENLEGQSIYASGEYGFTLRYPSKATVEEVFTPSYIIGTTWRANAIATGTPLLAVINYTTESDHSFPRNYTAMVRVGVSVDEVENCEKVTPDAGETALPDREINGTTWKAFSFGDAAMMKYVKGVSYRVEHNGTCYALEKIATGSSYRDDPESADDISQDTLDAEYAALDAIIETFSFSR
ncbi:MAG TPA: hypothetical protein PK109_00775 [Candidatus Paceibacterota bacterium]|nr:hypothetical protein [Candidatus Paceibacterota bacterium]